MTSAARITSTAAERTWLMISVSARSGSCSKASRAVRAALRARFARLGRALRVVVGGGQAPHRLGELAHGVDQPVGRDEAGARVAQGVARQHARVAHREVQVGQRARVALEQAAGAPAGRREAHHLARRDERLLQARMSVVDRARGAQGVLGALGVGLRERCRHAFERLAEVARTPPAPRAPTISVGSGGKNSEPTAIATAPPVSASRNRSGE